MIVSTHPLAEEELVDGAVFYAEGANAKLGEDFIAEFERSIRLLRMFPKVGSPWRGAIPLARRDSSSADPPLPVQHRALPFG